MSKKINIAFILPSLKPAGAERIMSFLAQNIDKNTFDTTLIITGIKTENDYSNISSKLIYLNTNRVSRSIPKLIKYLKNDKQDIVVSSIIHLNLVVGFLSFIIKKTKFVARESSVISKNNTEINIKNKLSSHLVKIVYNHFDKIICQSNDMKTDLTKMYNIKKEKLIIINNPITKSIKISPQKKTNKKKLNLITVGRLGSVKGYNRLIKILSKIEFDFNYTIIGSGDKESLFEEINKYGLKNKITHIPFTDNVYKYLQESDLFLQGSYVEGFPNALLESCVAGTPAIAFNVPGGTKEIIDHGINGYLVEDEDDFLLHLNNFNKSNFNAEEVAESVIKKFNKQKIIKQYESLFLDILK
ncbi:MAG: glycosyltransferase [Arcobacter sp.]|nr:glycosyltransferase [Arcobacter sp.]